MKKNILFIGGSYGIGLESAKLIASEYALSFRVNLISPSLTDTKWSENLLSKVAKREKMGERHPLKRVENPEDIANAFSFLLSKKSSWMTGQLLVIDGGLSTLNVN
jgi:3-oxoacyl-[acyl-carrier protein] reductase